MYASGFRPFAPNLCMFYHQDKKVKKLYLALAAAPLPVGVMIYGMSIWLQDFFRKVKRFLDAHSKDWKFPSQEHTRLMRKPVVLISSSHAACKFMDSFMILQKEETLDSPKTTNSQLSATIEEQAICYVKAFCNRRAAA